MIVDKETANYEEFKDYLYIESHLINEERDTKLEIPMRVCSTEVVLGKFHDLAEHHLSNKMMYCFDDYTQIELMNEKFKDEDFTEMIIKWKLQDNVNFDRISFYTIHY